MTLELVQWFFVAQLGMMGVEPTTHGPFVNRTQCENGVAAYMQQMQVKADYRPLCTEHRFLITTVK